MEKSKSTPGALQYDPFTGHDNSSRRPRISNSTKVSTLVSDDTEYLCKRCEEIDINKAFRFQDTSPLGKLVKDLGASISQWETSKCPLCKLFASVAPSDSWDDGSGRQSFELRAYLRKVSLGGKMTVLGVGLSNNYNTPSTAKYLGCSLSDINSEGFGVRSICPTLFDASFARNCITYCQNNHQESCESASKLRIAHFFRVIDCKTRAIMVAPPGCIYAALSYVWGTVPKTQLVTEPSNCSSLHNCPKVISDSMEVALKINIRYLWVDQYCIDQSSAQDKESQIRQMDLIYANAQVTIIAAQTQVSSTGLPGVSEPRIHLPSYTIRGHFIAPTQLRSWGSVKKSKWVTRGWTYQEGVLAKRRLIFTDDQLFFECNEMQCAESLILPLTPKHAKKMSALEDMMKDDPMNLDSPINDVEAIMEHIQKFSMRELTFQEDRLNAMCGIFRKLERHWPPVYQTMGVPIMPPYYMNYHICKEKLSRTPEQGFLIGLTWEQDLPGAKLALFPSWSWAAWTGEIQSFLRFQKTWDTSPKDARVYLELQDGSLSPFPDLEAFSVLKSDTQIYIPRFIHLEASTFACMTVRPEEMPQNLDDTDSSTDFCLREQLARLVVDESTEYYLYISFDRQLTEEEQSSKMLTGILIGDLSIYETKNLYPEPRVVILFVEELDGHAERIGLGCFDSYKACVYTDNKEVPLTREFLLESSKKFLKRRTIRIG